MEYSFSCLINCLYYIIMWKEVYVMKENKLFIGLLGVVFIVLVGCVFFSFNDKREVKKKDAVLIKEEYEALNGNEDYVSVSLDDDNPYVYRSYEDIIKMIEEKSGIILFASAKSNSSRSVISLISEIAHELKFENVAYLDIMEDRDEYTLDKINKPIESKEGTKDYKKLLDVLDKELVSYVLEGSDGKKVNVGEKRIYMPTLVAVYNGEIQSVYSVSLNEDEEIDKDSLKKLKDVYVAMFKSVTEDICDDAC